MFIDREDAGRKLALALRAYRGSDAVVIALPRGGVPPAFVVARQLQLPLDIRMPHKIGAPFNPEMAIGAVTEQGEVLYERAVIDRLGVSLADLQRLGDTEFETLQRRLVDLRRGLKRQSLSARTAILVDDGLATGSTMQAAVHMLRAEGARRVVVAVPVGPPPAVAMLNAVADEVVCLLQPPSFAYVGQYYESFEQVQDEEVHTLLRDAAADPVNPVGGPGQPHRHAQEA